MAAQLVSFINGKETQVVIFSELSLLRLLYFFKLQKKCVLETLI